MDTIKKCSVPGLLLAALLCVLSVQTSVAQAQNPAKEKILPGEQAPPAHPGQNNFGGVRPPPGTPVAPRPPRPDPPIQTVPFEEINMSDPFIFPDQKTRTYYLTGTGGRLYKSKDLKMWTGPYPIIDL